MDLTQFKTTILDNTITFEVAKRERRCRRPYIDGNLPSCTGINGGDIHLAVYISNQPPIRENYCMACAWKYLLQTREKVNAAISELDLLEKHL